jgi:hypothetical protein
VNADREAYLERDEEGWLPTGKVTRNWKKVGCKQGSILGNGVRRVDPGREGY